MGSGKQPADQEAQAITYNPRKQVHLNQAMQTISTSSIVKARQAHYKRLALPMKHNNSPSEIQAQNLIDMCGKAA